MAFPLVPVIGTVLPAVTSFVKDTLAPKPKNTLDKDDFLKLLITQLRHQDPLKPMDNDKLLTQQTGFATVEELQNIRKSLETSASGTSGAIASGTAFLGKPVTATSAGFTYAGATVNLPFTLDTPVTNGAVEITDAGGNVVHQIPLGARGAGSQSVDLTPGALTRALGAGQYRYRVVSRDASGRGTPLPAIAGVVSGVTVDGGAPVLNIGSRRISVSDVVSVGMANN
jgi:flagellar basal-body rod modification protein FlgD